MNAPDPRSQSLLYHVKIGMAVGLAIFFAFGSVNALLVLGGTAIWVKQFVQDAVIPQGARASLLRSTPIFAISAFSHGYHAPW